MNITALSKQVLLIIMDGLGSNPTDLKNAVLHAKTPNLDSYKDEFPYLEIHASGELVGLPKGVMGNSEVGHLNLGAGRSIRQDLVRINEAIELDTLTQMEKLQELVSTTHKASGRIHLMGLLSDGGVHSHIDHIKALIKSLDKLNSPQIYLHAFMDGRDTQKENGKKYLAQLLELEDQGLFKLASIQGRSIAMDRDKRWEKTQRAYDTMLGLDSNAITNLSALNYIQGQYDQEIYDEFIEPALFSKESAIKENDSVFFINFRPDRARQLTLAFNKKDFSDFPTSHKLSYYLCMTPYLAEEMPELNVLFNKERVSGGLSEYLSNQKLTQYKSAETEKYAHVTFFFNGGVDSPFPGEHRVLVPSPRDVKTYDEKPEMSALEVKENLMKALDENYDFHLVNFANPDMVGHTGNYEAAIKAVETLDNCLGEVIPKALAKNMAIILTADHGNCDQMVYPDGSAHTSHTTALVPVHILHNELKGKELIPSQEISHRALKDIAPTVTKLLGLDKPETFKGNALY